MVQLIDGKKVARELVDKVKQEVATLPSSPGLAVILIGEDPASEIYVNIKRKRCNEIGIVSYLHQLDSSVTQDVVLQLIDKLNNDPKITGILVQMPTPSQISDNKIMIAVNPKKDVDGFNPINIGNLVLKKEGLQSCTPRGIHKLLKYYNIPLQGQEVVVIGSSIIVGNPVAQMFLNANSTVTVCNIDTKDLKMHTQKADIIVSATGKKHILTADMIKEEAVIVDVGIIRENGKIYGDVDFENVKDKCSYITPVPGGVGPMTIACLMENTLIAYNLQNGGEK
jgi:methylenetetrahydrofolate dehydrogenase (NADP+) / methenyltetrahydrofolate cyclohydrolase